MYWVDYEEGQLRAQDPKETIFRGQKIDGDAPTPSFPFDANSLASKVFANRRPALFDDATKAMEEGLIAKDYKEALKIKGAIFGFPVFVRGYVAGVVVGWRLGDECEGGFSSRQVDLFRRAGHLIANSRVPVDSSVAPPSASGKVAIELANEVIDWFSFPPTDEKTTADELNWLGQKCSQEFGHRLRRLLEGISARYGKHRRKFVVPRRCRCWLRTFTGPKTEPRFVLGLEVSLQSPSDRNVYADGTGLKHGIATKPELLHPPAQSRQKASADSAPSVEEVFLGCSEKLQTDLQPVTVRQFVNDAHLSFLLSRVRADRFSKLQPVADDAMEKILNKRPGKPWYVTPIVLPSSDDWRDSRSEGTEERLSLAILPSTKERPEESQGHN